MIVAVILLAVCQLAGGILAGILVSRKLDRIRTETRTELLRILTDWTHQPEAGKPSKAAELVDMIGAVIGSAAARSIMGSLKADDSHAAAAANRIADGIQGHQNPLLGLLTGGKRGKGAAVARLAEMLGGMLGGSGAGGAQLPFPTNGGSEKSTVADRIRRNGGM